VISDPDITIYDPQLPIEFLLLASDGLWEVMSCGTVAAFVIRRIREYEEIDREKEKEREGLRGKEKASKESDIERERVKSEKRSRQLWGVRAEMIAKELVRYVVDDLRGKDNVSVILLYFITPKE
jgi:serine/threonine protein phosphatase PrpC